MNVIDELGRRDASRASIRVDLNRTLVTMPYPHDAVHRDIMVNATDYQAAGTTDVIYFIFGDDAQECHLEFAITGGAAARVLMYEGPTIATQGDAITVARLYRPSAKTTKTVFKVGGTVTGGAYGTLLKTMYNGGGGAGSSTRGGASVHEGAEWVLKLATNYCIRVIRDASGPIGADFEWYDVPPYGGRQ